MAKEKVEMSSLDYIVEHKCFTEFIERLQKCTKLHKPLSNTLANIFSMRYIGNKNHGDLAEIAITEFINTFMYNYECRHVGKDLFRSKDYEEDIAVKNKAWNKEIYMPISIKAYGIGPLQLSTDKSNTLFNFLLELNSKDIKDKELIDQIKTKVKDTVLFNVLLLIHKEKELKDNDDKNRKYSNKCNIMLFDVEKMMTDLTRVIYIEKGQEFDIKLGKIHNKVKGKRRKHPISMFLNQVNNYICEVRYGGPSANALQRGLWSDTSSKGSNYFILMFDNWINYEKRENLLVLIQRALNSTTKGHIQASDCLQNDIANNLNSAKIINESTN